MIVVSVSVQGLGQVHFKFNPGDDNVHLHRLSINSEDSSALLETVKTQIKQILNEKIN